MTEHSDQFEEPQSGGFFNHLPTIFWQRRWFVIPPFVLLSAAGVIAATLMPTTYRSSATLLVQSQELPSTVVNSPTSTLIDQRIAKIRQQVLSRGDLIELIEQNDLYGEERRSKPLSQVVENMRQATAVQAVTGDVGQQQSGQTNTVAFTMSFDYRDPAKAQAVMQSLVSRFLEIDTSTLADQATNTVSFLQDQTSNLRRQIAVIEGQITAIKARNGTALAGAGIVTASDPSSYDAQIVALQNQNRALALQTRRATKDPLIAAAESQLEIARTTYAENHPDVVLAKQRLAQLRSAGGSGAAEDRTAEAATIRSQIEANNSTIAALGRARSMNSARASASIAAQSRGPAIMEQVAQLDNRAGVLRQQYERASENLLQAQNSARMAQEQKGERLSIVDPPALPDKPISPNRPLLIAGGIAAGLGLGLVLALLIEFMLRPVRGVGMIEDMGLEPLAVIPTLKPDERRKPRWFGRRRAPVQPA